VLNHEYDTDTSQDILINEIDREMTEDDFRVLTKIQKREFQEGFLRNVSRTEKVCKGLPTNEEEKKRRFTNIL